MILNVKQNERVSEVTKALVKNAKKITHLEIGYRHINHNSFTKTHLKKFSNLKELIIEFPKRTEFKSILNSLKDKS